MATGPSNSIDELCDLIEQAAAFRLGRPSMPAPRDLGRRLLEARAQLGAGRLEESRKILYRVAAECPSSFLAHAMLAETHRRRDQELESIREQIFAQSAAELLPPEDESHFSSAMNGVREYTMLSAARLRSLYVLARQICADDLPGNFAECGTCAGGSAALVASAIKRYSTRPRLLFAFDTFEGMPEPTEKDRHAGVAANETAYGAGTLKAPAEENLNVVCGKLDVSEIVHAVKGLFKETLPATRSEIGPISLLHADGDWYESTLDIFDNLFELVIPNGIVQIDDYGFWEGCQRAVGEYQQGRQLTWLLRRIDETGVWFRKESSDPSQTAMRETIDRLLAAIAAPGDRAQVERCEKSLGTLVPGLIRRDPPAGA
jgi:hypothetical protein